MHGPWPPRRPGGRGLPVALLAPLGLQGCSANASGSGPWLFGAVALLVAAGASYALGNLRARVHAERAQRDACRALRAVAALVDGWTWQTDADHRVRQLAPPPGGDDGAPPAAVGDALDARFDDGVTVRELLQARRPFADLRVQTADGAAWLLRGTPCFDDDGGFAGYAGSARSAGTAAAEADRAPLPALLEALPTAAAVAVGNGRPDGWRLLHANAGVRRLLEGSPVGWPQVIAKLPTALRDAVDAGGAEPAEADGWLLRPLAVDAGRALLVQQQAPAAEDGERGESASFSFTLSHDLRAPIRVVEGFTRILKEDYGRLLDRVGNDHLDRVLGAAARMNHMIDALLALAKLSQQPLARQRVNLSQLATYVVDDLRRSAPERAADIEIEPGMLVEGDPTLLRLVLENLLGNAWKYTARVGRAQIVFGREMIEGRRTYVVRDNGAGFDMRSADRLFGLFQRLHSAADFAGTGVGLASVKRIVRRHGGDVWADAEPGRGAAFHFTLRD